MRVGFSGLSAMLLSMIFLLSACGGLQQQVSVGPGTGQKVLSIEASSFKFEPNNIKAVQGDSLLIKITNTSESGHQFTLKDPKGNVLKSVDLPPKQTVEVGVTLLETGTYSFYCDKPLHSTFGMNGQIEVAKP